MPDWRLLLDMTARLMLAAVLGGLIGYERETHGRPAGLRTHMLVCMGSAIFTIVSTTFTGVASDPARIASQIVSGIGFLGAGTIIRQGSVVRGLTTAASLWTIAGIGMAVGVDWRLSLFATVASVVVFLTLSVINRVEHATISRRRYRELAIMILEGQQQAATVLAAISAQGAQILSVRNEAAEEPGIRLLRMRLRFPAEARIDSVTESLSEMQGVRSIEWELG